MRIELPESIRTERVIPVARGLDAARGLELATALAAGGLSTLEITLEGSSGIEAIAAVAGSDLTVGAGTVTSVEQAALAMEAGASFLVSPHVDRTLIEWAASQRVPYLPGGFTPTEIWEAWSQGVAAVKVFPASTGGPAHLGRLLGPYPEVALVPTGGVDASNVADFLAAGAVAVGVGTWLTGAADLALVRERATRIREVV